jgi:hypothetical protein
MTYVELRAAIQEYSEDYEASFVNNIDTFIRLAESRILLRVRLPRFRKDATGAAIASQAQLPVPSDFLAPDSVIVVNGTSLVPLINKDPEFLAECYPDSSVTAIPRFYSQLNELTLLLGPAPDQSYPLRLGYFYQPPSIVDAGVSWLGDHFGHSLLTGSLVEAGTYMKTEDALWQRYFTQFEADLKMDLEYAKGRTAKDLYQDPDTRLKV